MSNEWALGLASGAPFDAAAVARFQDGLGAADSTALKPLMEIAVTGVENANSTFFRFDVESACEEGEPRLVHLTPTADARGHQLGLTEGHSTRKLVALVVLAVTGEGVALRLDGHDKHVDAQPGQLVIFPAYCNLVVSGPPGCAVDVTAFHALGPAFR